MPRNWIEFITPDDIQLIHDTSMRLLDKVGVRFPESEAIAIFQEHGAKVENQIVYLPERLVMEALGAAPAQFILRARNPSRDITIGGGETLFAPAYGAPFVFDLQAGKRGATLEDYHNLARLAHALPNQDLSGHLMVEPGDAPPQSAYLHMLHANMVHSDKPFIGSTQGARGANHTLEMAAILFGERPQEPVAIGVVNPLSPLGYSREMAAALVAYARARQPLIIATLVMAGSTGPVTLAGALAQQNAELLAGVVLAQWISPGAPVVYGSTSTNIDMRTGALAIGGPELALMVSAHAQLARYYGLPSRAGGALTDANSPDMQAGLESMFGLLTAVNSGIDFVLHAAGILSSYLAFSYEKFVLDDEMCGMLRRYRHGIQVTPETLAYEVIADVGPGGNFLTEEHTLERCRSEFWTPEIFERRGLDAWMGAGRLDAAARARQRWQALLHAHEDPPLDKTTLRQLNAYINEHSP